MRSDFPEYSEEGKRGLAILHQYWANAVFYCEDESHEVFYERLIRRIIPNAKNFLVVCLGGKGPILKAIKSTEDASPIPEVFIVDKDYDDLTGDLGRNAYDNLIYLRRHSIENYLTQINALLEIAVEQKATSGISMYSAHQKIADSHKFYSHLMERLIYLCRYFLVARKNGVKVRTSKISCSEIYENSDSSWPLPPDEWLEEYIAEFSDKCMLDHEWLLQDGVIQVQLADAFKATDTPWGNLPIDHHVVGKHLMGGLVRYIDNCLETELLKMKDAELYTRLAVHIDTTDLGYLRSDILRVVPALA